jgi:hypothetical protein
MLSPPLPSSGLYFRHPPPVPLKTHGSVTILTAAAAIAAPQHLSLIRLRHPRCA